MPKAMILIGNANAGSPTPSTPEDAAFEYFVNRGLAGNFAPKPPIQRLRADHRERFTAELERLERRDCRTRGFHRPRAAGPWSVEGASRHRPGEAFRGTICRRVRAGLRTPFPARPSPHAGAENGSWPLCRRERLLKVM
jgi:hypothetical protein